MQADVNKVAVRTVVELLSLQETEEQRMKTLEEFDQVFGACIPEWEELFKKQLWEIGAEAAIKTVEAFHAKYHVYDEDGALVYERTRVGNAYLSLTITFDRNAPDGKQIKVEATPDIDAMSLEELQGYYEDLESAFGDLEDEEPDEDSEAYEAWEEEHSALENLMVEVQEKIEELEGDSGASISLEINIKKD